MPVPYIAVAVVASWVALLAIVMLFFDRLGKAEDDRQQACDGFDQALDRLWCELVDHLIADAETTLKGTPNDNRP